MKAYRLRNWIAMSCVLGAAVVSGGCAVYSTPSGDVIGPAPVVIAPPAVVVSPFGFYGSYRSYPGPRYYGRGGYGGPRYYGRPYYRY